MWALLLALSAAEPLQVTVSSLATDSSCHAGTLTVTADDGQVITHEWVAGRPLTLPIDGARSWSVQAAARGCWAEPFAQRADDARREVNVRIWPSRTLSARLLVPRGETFPSKVSARIASPPRGAVPETDVACVRTAERVQCEVPAVPLDIRLSADGFAPVYLWGIDADQLGEVKFSRGTIVTGRARSAIATEAIDVELRPSSMAWGPEEQERVKRQKHVARTNARGFFQFNNVAPGEYTVVATKKGWSPAEYRVHVTPVATEAVVGRELVPGELAKIEVALHPPVDAEQRPWTVALSRVVTGNSEPVARSEASLAGQWSHEALEQGIYGITVLDATGATVASEGVSADGGPARLVLAIDQVAVRGTITLGGKKIAAPLRFTELSGKRIDLRSDEEGRFAGRLPSQATWDVEVRRGASRITMHDVDVRRGESGYAELELELPAGRVRGKVVDAAGQPHVANVTLFRDRRREASARTEADGEFEFAGVEKGAVELTADARAGQSGSVPHAIAGADDAPLRIVIAPRKVVRARVLSPDGRPVAGALVTWVTAHAIRDVITAPTGDFTIQLPPDFAGITIYVSAPGFPLKIAHLPVRGSEVTDVRLPAVAGMLLVRYDTKRWHSLMFGRGNDRLFLGATNGMGAPREGMPVRFMGEGCLLNVEPGRYTVCQGRTDRCETIDVRAGARETIDATEWSH